MRDVRRGVEIRKSESLVLSVGASLARIRVPLTVLSEVTDRP